MCNTQNVVDKYRERTVDKPCIAGCAQGCQFGMAPLANTQVWQKRKMIRKSLRQKNSTVSSYITFFYLSWKFDLKQKNNAKYQQTLWQHKSNQGLVQSSRTSPVNSETSSTSRTVPLGSSKVLNSRLAEKLGRPLMSHAWMLFLWKRGEKINTAASNHQTKFKKISFQWKFENCEQMKSADLRYGSMSLTTIYTIHTI